GVSLAAARAEATTIAKRLKQRYGQDTLMSDAAGLPRHDELGGNVRPVLLLVACANLADVLLARLSARRRELAVRAALGATGTAIILPLVAESLIVSICGA